VLSTPDVTATSGFCSQYCGWHTYDSLGTRVIWVGNPEQLCLNSCSPGAGPNGRRGADAMVNIIAHEIAEATSDGYVNAYVVPGTYAENGDICAWTFGATLSFGGGEYNVQVGAYKFLIQQLVDFRNAGTQVCDLVHNPLPASPQGAYTCDAALPIVPGALTSQTNFGTIQAAAAPMTVETCAPTSNDLYYQLTIPVVPQVCSVDTCLGDFNSVIGIFTDCGATTSVGCNDNLCGGTAQSNVTFTATQSTYIIGVGSYAGTIPGIFQLRVVCVPPTPQPPSTHKPTSKHG